MADGHVDQVFDPAPGADDISAPGRLIEWVWKPSWSIAIPRLIVVEVCARVSINVLESGGGRKGRQALQPVDGLPRIKP